jgi:hypothetical protein
MKRKSIAEPMQIELHPLDTITVCPLSFISNMFPKLKRECLVCTTVWIQPSLKAASSALAPTMGRTQGLVDHVPTLLVMWKNDYFLNTQAYTSHAEEACY